jgi:hypothetical protein
MGRESNVERRLLVLLEHRCCGSLKGGHRGPAPAPGTALVHVADVAVLFTGRLG